jgi:hypothetical protein
MFLGAIISQLVGRWSVAAFLGIVLFSAFPLSAADSAKAGANPFAAEAVRAVYILNFLRFTEWPDEPQADSVPLVVGFAGATAVEDELIRLANRQTVRGRPLKTIRIKSRRDLEECHVVYFDSAPEPTAEPVPSAAELLPLLVGRPVLTISESSSFIGRGGLVNLYTGENSSLRFEIAADRAKACGLKFSSRLLALARIVSMPPGTP